MVSFRSLLYAHAFVGMSAVSNAQTPSSLPDFLATSATRIELYRKTNATVRVIDDSGVPVRGATIKVEQLRHKFLFGCNAFPLLNNAEKDREAQYETKLTEILNYATLGYY